MYKFVALFALFACAAAAPAPEPAPGYLAAEPLALAHSIPVATSYANTYKVSVKSPVIAAAPYIAGAPIAAATFLKTAPLVAAAPATTFYAHQPLVAATAYHY